MRDAEAQPSFMRAGEGDLEPRVRRRGSLVVVSALDHGRGGATAAAAATTAPLPVR